MVYLGIPPTVDCGEGVHIPIYVNGQYVFDDQPPGQCDHTDFKGGCYRGSTVSRIQGIDEFGNSMPHVVWVFFCRSAGASALASGIVSVQMIGYNIQTGATCFFESPDAVGDLTQSQYLYFDENGILKSRDILTKDNFTKIEFSKDKTTVIRNAYGITDQLYDAFTKGQ